MGEGELVAARAGGWKGQEQRLQFGGEKKKRGQGAAVGRVKGKWKGGKCQGVRVRVLNGFHFDQNKFQNSLFMSYLLILNSNLQ